MMPHRRGLGIGARLGIACLVSLLSPHPISFREGGYLPIAVMVPSLDAWDTAAMFGLLFAVYTLLWLGVTTLVFGGHPRTND